jgi:pilus assembly protein Flp/PilA
MFQDPPKQWIRLASLASELATDQPSELAQESKMLALYTHFMTRLRSEEKGATAVEYGIMVGLIAVVIIVAVSTLGGTLGEFFESINIKLGTPSPTTAP